MSFTEDKPDVFCELKKSNATITSWAGRERHRIHAESHTGARSRAIL